MKYSLFMTIAFLFTLISCGYEGGKPPISTNSSIGGSSSSVPYDGASRVADHTVVAGLWQGRIPETAIAAARSALRIGYGHTSHGSQICGAMGALVAFADAGKCGGRYTNGALFHNDDGSGGALMLYCGSGYTDPGLLMGDAGWSGNNLYLESREFLTNSAFTLINVIMWSWCGQLSGMGAHDVTNGYLVPMSNLEAEFPGVTFIYMTGHLDGTGTNGTLHRNNEIIRAYCRANNKWLFDFADIESYDPDGNEYLTRLANDECYYDSDLDGSPTTNDSNWALAWQAAHTVNEDWFNCSPAHSVDINGNMKAYAAWWLFARIAGWNGQYDR